jgi:hypothetical protein
MMSASLHQSTLPEPVRVAATRLDTGTVTLSIGSRATIGEVTVFMRTRAEALDLILRLSNAVLALDDDRATFGPPS